MIFTPVHGCFWICSNWPMLQSKLKLLREIFQKNGYPENFINICFKMFLNRFHILKEKVLTVEKKHLRLILPYLGAISHKLGLNCNSPWMGFLTVANHSFFFKILTWHVVHKFHCGLCNEFYYEERVRYFAVRSGEHVDISPLTNKRVQRIKDSVVCHHLLNCNYGPTFKSFTLLCHENKNDLLEMKDAFL